MIEVICYDCEIELPESVMQKCDTCGELICELCLDEHIESNCEGDSLDYE